MNIDIFLGHLSEWLGAIAITLFLALNDRFKKRPVIFKYPRREALIATAFYVIVLLVAFLFYHQFAAFPVDGLVQTLTPRLILAGMALIPFAVALRLRGQPLLSTGWNPALFNISLSLGIALVLLTIFLRGKFTLLLGHLNTEQWLALPLLLGICLCEETIFRGYIQPRLSAFWNERIGWLTTAILFVFWTLPRLLLMPETLPIQLGLVLVQGLLLGWITQKTGHVIAPTLYRAVSEWLLLF